MHKSIENKLLPNIMIVFLIIMLILSTLVIGSIYFMNTLTSRTHVMYMVDEINIFEIPIESIITSNINNANFNEKSTVNNALEIFSKGNDTNINLFYDIFNDKRIYNQVQKQLYSNIRKKYHNKYLSLTNESNTNLIIKIIEEKEMKNNITLNDTTKSQISNILLNFMYNANNLPDTDNTNIKILYNPLILSLAIIIILVSTIGIIIIEKNISKSLLRISNIWLCIGAFILLYSIIQKSLIMSLQFLIKNYNYTANVVGSNMFISMISFGIMLILVGTLIRIISKEDLKFPIISDKKKKKKKKKRKKPSSSKRAKKKKKSVKKLLKSMKYSINHLFKKKKDIPKEKKTK